MEAKLPVSALLHSATMVAVGIFLTLRLMPFVKSWKVFEDPYGAYESYEYGQKVKNK